MVAPRKKNKPLTIFLDSDAFIALLKKDDALHKKAVKFVEVLRNHEVVFTTSNYVFAETVTVISQLLGRDAALVFIKNIRSIDSMVSAYWLTERDEEQAIEIYTKQTSKNVSFVDCTNMALMISNHMDAIFSFDSAYKKNDLVMIEQLVEGWK